MSNATRKDGDAPAENEKITDGLNDRPRNETIGQTGGGIPDDSSRPVEIDAEEEKRIADKLRSP